MNTKSATTTFLALALLAPSEVVLANQSQLPVIEAKTDEATALAIGLVIGRSSKSMFPDIEARYDSLLGSFINQQQMNTLRESLLPELFNRLQQSHQDEIQGVEAAWELVTESLVGDGKLSADEYRLVNFLPDLGFMPNGSGFATIGKASKDNKPILGRNLDWKVSSDFKNLQAITVYKSNEQTIVNIGFAGMVSVITGYNSDGLFVAGLNAAPYSPYYRPDSTIRKNHTSVGFDVKSLLESKTNSKQALKYLSAKHYRHDINLMIADEKAVKVLEHSKQGNSQIRSWNSPLHASTDWDKRQQIAVVDCFALIKMPNNCQSANDLVRWKRFRQLANFDANSPASIKEISAVMTDTQNKRHEIFNQDTLQSVIFQPASGKLYLYSNRTAKPNDKPVYQAYFDFSETLVKSTQASSSFFNIKTLFWLLIAFLSTALWWFIKKRD